MTKREEMENAIFELGFVPLARRSLIGEPRLRLDAFLDKWAPTNGAEISKIVYDEGAAAKALSRIESVLLRLVQVEAMRGANEACEMHTVVPCERPGFLDIADWAAAREREMEGPKT
jgi:hypothetical protein